MKLEGVVKAELARLPDYVIVKKRSHYFAKIGDHMVLIAGQGTKFNPRNVASCVSKLRQIRNQLCR